MLIVGLACNSAIGRLQSAIASISARARSDQYYYKVHTSLYIKVYILISTFSAITNTALTCLEPT